MPSIKNSLVKLDDVELNTAPIPQTPTPPVNAGTYTQDLQPNLNPHMRCPLPGILVSPDSLRQFYRGGQLPQTRTLVAPLIGANGGSEAGGSGSVGGSSSGGTTTIKLAIKQTAITSVVVNPNKSFAGTIQLGKAFQLIGIATNIAARVELYGTQNALQLDAARSLDVPPAFGTTQGLILDVALDTTPYIWNLEGIMGSNFDSPADDSIYISLTNLSSTSSVITATLIYVPLVS